MFPWYETDMKFSKKYMVLISLMAQQKIGIRAGGFYYINYQSFAEVVNTAYNYFTILQTVLFENKK
jgi:hypothetical protein